MVALLLILAASVALNAWLVRQLRVTRTELVRIIDCVERLR